MKRLLVSTVLTALALFVGGCTKKYYNTITNPAAQQENATFTVGLVTPAGLPIGPKGDPESLSVIIMQEDGAIHKIVSMRVSETIDNEQGIQHFYRRDIEIPVKHEGSVYQIRVEADGHDVTHLARIRGKDQKYDWFQLGIGTAVGSYFGLECSGEITFANIPQPALGRSARISIYPKDGFTLRPENRVVISVQELTRFGEIEGWFWLPTVYRYSPLFGDLLTRQFTHEGEYGSWFYTSAPIALKPYSRKEVRIKAGVDGGDVTDQMLIYGPFFGPGTKGDDGFYHYTVAAGDEFPFGGGGGLGKVATFYKTELQQQN